MKLQEQVGTVKYFRVKIYVHKSGTEDAIKKKPNIRHEVPT